MLVKSVDQTADSVHVYLNLPAAATNQQILDMISRGDGIINGTHYVGGKAGQTDRDLFAFGFSNLQNGNNVATIISYEPDGNVNVQRVPANALADLGHPTLRGLGLGDTDPDDGNGIQGNDLDLFKSLVLGNNSAFNPGADMNGDGLIDYTDWQLLGGQLRSLHDQGTVSQGTLDYYNQLSPSVPEPASAGASASSEAGCSAGAARGGRGRASG